MSDGHEFTFVQKFVVRDEGSAALAKMGTHATALQKTVVGVGKVLLGIGAAHYFHHFISDVQSAFGEVRRLSSEMGVTGQQAYDMKEAFDIAGVGVNTLERGVQKWAMGMVAARKKTKELGDDTGQWAALGAKATESFPEAMALVARQIDHAATKQEKLVIATQYFGRAARDMLPALMLGEAKIREMTADRGEGGLFSPEHIAQVKAYTAESKKVGYEFEHMKLAVGLAIMPVLTKMAHNVMPAIEKATHGVVSAIGFAAEHAQTFTTAIQLAAAAWAGMKIGQGVSMLVKGALAIRAAAVATAAASAAGGVASIGAGAAAGSAGGPIGAIVGAAVGGAAMLWSALSASGEDTKKEEEDRVKKLAEVEDARAESEKAVVKIQEKEADTLKEFERATGIGADALKDLGLTADDVAAAMKAGAGAIRHLQYAAEAAATGDDAKKTSDTAARHQAAAMLIPGIRAYLASTGMDPNELVATRKAALAAAEQDIAENAPKMVGGGRIFGREVGTPHDAKRPTDPRAAADYDRAQQSLVTRRNAADEAYLAASMVAKQAAQKALEDADKAAEGAKHVTNINGPITIHQDFPEADPDRVLFTVFDEIKRVATNRTTSRTLAHYGTAQ